MSKSQVRHIYYPVSSIDRDRNYNISINMAVFLHTGSLLENFLPPLRHYVAQDEDANDRDICAF